MVPQRTRHVAHVGRCERCTKRVAAKLPGSPATGKSVAEVSLGPNVQAMALGLRFEQDVPLGKIGAFLGQWYGISRSQGGSWSGGDHDDLRNIRRMLPSSHAAV